jgi:predicted nucleotide-binding protein
MNDKQSRQVRSYLNDTDSITSEFQIDRWSKRVFVFLEEALGIVSAARFTSLTAADKFDELALKQGYLEGLVASFDEESGSQVATPSEQAVGRPQSTAFTREVFVVHGHDGEAKESVARFLEKLELVPIILHEQPNQGRTLIEKFETSSSGVAFAVVLLTPDDLGRAANCPPELHPRARQNVILELGYFVGRLSRMRVCALYKGGVELPSDFQGVVYIELDSAGAWRTKLAQEFVAAKLPIQLEGLINK